MNTHTYSVDDFMRSFRADPSERAVIADEARNYDFNYVPLSLPERDGVVAGILEKLDGFTRVGGHRHAIWERCWSDARTSFHDADGDLAALDPPFMGAHPIVRLDGDYVRPTDPKFERRWFTVLRRWLFARHLVGAKKIYEFGCGSGFNLAAAARQFPGAELVGLDWSQSAVELVDDIGRSSGFRLAGRHFDFFAPDDRVPVGSDSVAMTFAALEQTGERFRPFAEWLLRKRPKLVLSMEPILEFYDPASPVDQLAIRYHVHRGYLDGYYGWVKAQADAGRVEIVQSLRPYFGSLYHEAYSIVAWRPV
jgi:SAM-dependent methyltransferase